MILYVTCFAAFLCCTTTRVLITGKIPPNSALVFDIEVLDIQNGPRSHESFREMDLNDDWKLSRQEVRLGF